MIKLTQFSPGAGCGCKIAPASLQQILKSNSTYQPQPNLLVGYNTADDAAVYAINQTQAIISTTDFFTPIVDDPIAFGQIAATNAISDVYAMGGTPLLAISVLGWPLDKLPEEIAARVIEGARAACNQAGIAIAGGHSINIADPVFGLAVTGIVKIADLKTNAGATAGCSIYLTKPLGVGIVTTAEKHGKVQEPHRLQALELMCTLNRAGQLFSKLAYVKALTDVTGFGLAGHLLEMCNGANLHAQVSLAALPTLPGLDGYIAQNCIPGGVHRNFKSYGHQLGPLSPEAMALVCDPQTSGGLMVAIQPGHEQDFEQFAQSNSITIYKIGVFTNPAGTQAVSFNL